MHEIFAPIGAKTDRFAALHSYGSEKQHHESKNPSKSNKSVGYKGADKATNLSIISLFASELMLTRNDIAQVERIENAHHKAIHSTFACRNQGPKAWKAWEDATSAWHAQRYPTNKLWEDDFLADLRASDREAIEESILNLEVDPWYFRSGYLKERLIRGLKAAKLTERDRRRLRNVIWNVAAGRNRREYRDYCSLAAVVADSDLIRLLEDVSPERDQDAKGKFGYLLGYLQQNTKLSEQGVAPNA